MEAETLRSLVEAVLLTARGPVDPSSVAQATDGEATVDEVDAIIAEMEVSWREAGRGVRLERSAGGWRCVTPPEHDHHLRLFHGIASRQKLSQAALEVLAIVAHRQPVTLPEINFIRGTNSAKVTRNLLDRQLIRLAGRKKVVGKPFLYRTTKEFLLHFGLDRAEDLPDPEELVEAEADAEA